MQIPGSMQPAQSLPQRPPSYNHQDYELKRRYLSLLPPNQIIDICLAFEFHAPIYVKTSVWPQDINAAITVMQRSLPHVQPKTELPDIPIMDALLPDENEKSEPAANTSSTSEQTPETREKKPPDSSAPTTGRVPPSVFPVPPHVLQHYRFPPGTYNQTPYFPAAPHPAWPYPHAPPYPNTRQAQPGYPPPHPSPGFASSVPHRHPAPPSSSGDPGGSAQSADELPSYEEMIVEALTETNDPDGMMAPKDLFNWIEAHYPVQSNFRPSASQALQKAFRRGRFQKSDTGKYRLAPDFKGTVATRRTTRRPHGHNTGTTPGASSPFTFAPRANTPGQPIIPYPPPPFGYPYPEYPSSQHQQSTANEVPESNPELEGAYEAARQILKSINLSSLYKIPKDEDEKPGSTNLRSDTVGDVNGTSGGNNTSGANGHLGSQVMTGGNGVATGTGDGGRARLQGQLALLAAQLAEVA